MREARPPVSSNTRLIIGSMVDVVFNEGVWKAEHAGKIVKHKATNVYTVQFKDGSTRDIHTAKHTMFLVNAGSSGNETRVAGDQAIIPNDRSGRWPSSRRWTEAEVAKLNALVVLEGLGNWEKKSLEFVSRSARSLQQKYQESILPSRKRHRDDVPLPSTGSAKQARKAAAPADEIMAAAKQHKAPCEAPQFVPVLRLHTRILYKRDGSWQSGEVCKMATAGSTRFGVEFDNSTRKEVSLHENGFDKTWRLACPHCVKGSNKALSHTGPHFKPPPVLRGFSNEDYHLLGRRVNKKFNDGKYYKGTVTHVSEVCDASCESPSVWVSYDDQQQESLTHEQLEGILIKPASGHRHLMAG